MNIIYIIEDFVENNTKLWGDHYLDQYDQHIII